MHDHKLPRQHRNQRERRARRQMDHVATSVAAVDPDLADDMLHDQHIKDDEA